MNNFQNFVSCNTSGVYLMRIQGYIEYSQRYKNQSRKKLAQQFNYTKTTHAYVDFHEHEYAPAI